MKEMLEAEPKEMRDECKSRKNGGQDEHCPRDFDWKRSRIDRLCGLVVRVLGYRSGGPGSILGTTKKKLVGLVRGPLSLVSTTEELLDRKVAAPV
jgi:hypothetical protein